MTANEWELGSLAEAHELHDDVALHDEARDDLLEGLATMLRIRLAEERIGDEVAQGRVKCPCHLAIGQEAVPVGVSAALRPTDRAFGAHRSHGHYLALGGPLVKLFAEVLGRDTGASRGMGGSMHLRDPERGLVGTVPIVGATIPVAVGAGLAAKMDGNGDIAVSYFGDGSTEEGVFHESMNLAASMQLPVLFVCENNLFSSHLYISIRQPATSVARYAEAHRMRWARVDGNDLVAVRRTVREAVAAMRRGGGPFFVEAVTYRWRGHVGPREDEDVGVKRKDDLAAWKGRDPVRRLANALTAAGALPAGGLAALRRQVEAEVAAAWAEAERAPFPPSSALLDRVWAGGVP